MSNIVYQPNESDIKMLRNYKLLHEGVIPKNEPMTHFLYWHHIPMGENPVLHWHKDVEIVLCVEGEGYVHTGTKVIHLKKGDIATINSKVIHAYTSKKDLVLDILMVYDSFFSENELDIKSFLFKEKITDPHAERLMKELSTLFEQKDKHLYSLKFQTAFSNFLTYMCENHPYTKDIATPYNSKNYAKMLDIVEYIETNYSQKLTLESLAHQAGYSKYHFARLFKEITGISAMEFVNNVRCDIAKSKLAYEEDSISRICHDVGFSDNTYFSYIFKKNCGQTPSSYRTAFRKILQDDKQ